MKRFIEGEERRQVSLLPECLDDYIAEDNPVRAVEAFVNELRLAELGFGSGDQVTAPPLDARTMAACMPPPASWVVSMRGSVRPAATIARR